MLLTLTLLSQPTQKPSQARTKQQRLLEHLKSTHSCVFSRPWVHGTTSSMLSWTSLVHCRRLRACPVVAWRAGQEGTRRRGRRSSKFRAMCSPLDHARARSFEATPRCRAAVKLMSTALAWSAVEMAGPLAFIGCHGSPTPIRAASYILHSPLFRIIKTYHTHSTSTLNRPWSCYQGE